MAPGRQILALEATKYILSSKVAKQVPDEKTDLDRQPFQHPALADVDKLHDQQPKDVIPIKKLAKLGFDVGLSEVMRWKPRMVSLIGVQFSGYLLTDIFLAGKP